MSQTHNPELVMNGYLACQASPMEPDIRQFLLNILQTLSILLLWGMVNILVGLRYRMAVFYDGHIPGTILFYLWLVGSAVLMYRHIKAMWKDTLRQRDIS